MFKIKNLGFDQSILKSDLERLKQNGWIDRQTRAVFIEFTIYNPNINLFSNCLILFEFISTGQIISSSQFAPINLFDINNSSLVSFKIIMNVIYMIFISIFMINEIKEILKQGLKKYFKQFYNFIELLIISFSWAAFAMFLYRLYSSYQVYSLLQKYRKDFTATAQINSFIQSAFVNLQYISYCDDLLQVFLGLCSAFGTIRFIKLLRFNKKIIVFLQAFANSLKDLMALAVIFVIVWFSLVQSIYLIFNEKSAQFATFVATMETCFQLILGKFDVTPIINSSPVLGSVFYMIYNVIVVFTLINIFIVILTDHFKEAKLCGDLERVDPDLLSYFKFMLDSLFEKQETEAKAVKEYKKHDHINSFSVKIEDLVLKFDKVIEIKLIFC